MPRLRRSTRSGSAAISGLHLLAVTRLHLAHFPSSPSPPPCQRESDIVVDPSTQRILLFGRMAPFIHSPIRLGDVSVGRWSTRSPALMQYERTSLHIGGRQGVSRSIGRPSGLW